MTDETRLVRLLSWPIRTDSPEHREVCDLCLRLQIRLRLNLPTNTWERTADEGETWQRLDPHTLMWKTI